MLENFVLTPQMVLSIASVCVSLGIFTIFVISHRATKRSNQAAMVAKLMEEYTTSEMNKAIENLKWLREKVPLEQWQAWRHAGVEESKTAWVELQPHYSDELDDSRRFIHWFFKKAYMLHQFDYLNDDCMKLICDVTGYPLLFDVVWPMSRIKHYLNIKPDDKRFDWFSDMEHEFPPIDQYRRRSFELAKPLFGRLTRWPRIPRQ